MSQHGYSIGRDITLTVIDGNGAAFDLGKVTAFEAKQDTTEGKIKRLDGITDNMQFYDEGWTGSFNMERSGPDVDLLFNLLQSNYQQGLDQAYFTILETINEPAAGLVTQFQYKRVTLKLVDAGKWEAGKTVSQKIDFWAGERDTLA